MRTSQKKGDILNFKKCLDNGNLWFLPFSFQWLYGHTFLNRKSNFNLIIFKTFFFGVPWRGFLKETQAWVALGVNLMRNSWFCILVRYCNIVTPILKSKISLLRLVAEELWNIRGNFSIFIIWYRRFASNVNGCIIRWKNISADKNFFRFSRHQLQFRSAYQCMIAGMKKC